MEFEHDSAFDYLENAAAGSSFLFAEQRSAVPAAFRIPWRVGVLLLVLGSCRAESASLSQIHAVSWALRTPRSRRAFIRAIRGESLPTDPGIRYEPTVNLAIDVAAGLGLVEWRRKHTRVVLTEKGKAAAGEVQRSPEIFAAEKDFLGDIGCKITMSMIERLNRG